MNEQLMNVLSSLLNTNKGREELNKVKGMNMNDLEQRVANIDKQAVVNKLYALNLNDLANKVNLMSNAEILNLIKSNPQILNFINNL